MILGYRHPAVSEAIAAQLSVGPTLTLTHPVEVQVAQMLTEMVPCAEMVAFGKNGSDAVTAAVRLARAVTGREMILQYGGHGFHYWFVALHRRARRPTGARVARAPIPVQRSRARSRACSTSIPARLPRS